MSSCPAPSAFLRVVSLEGEERRRRGGGEGDGLHRYLTSHTGFTGLHLSRALCFFPCPCRNRVITARAVKL
ncbi:TATA-binding protein-associated factor 172 [Dissostichus eleginoides]|uniref:TATA-binding protein-associated factor 172 n=1 Tax=Dissostichus eleginoides TaxID=100907 RepID=A0AAD9CKW3_DISEL|nr:TATA-binding protein-associated factor 172 [Dissostichus eleginoides]